MLMLTCVILYKQHQNTLEKMDISTNRISTDAISINYKTDISIIDVPPPSFSSTDGSILSNIAWQNAYDCKEKKILWDVNFIAIISKNKILAYINIPENILEFLPRNTFPTFLLFRNPINMGMVVNTKDTPFFKYALLKKDGLFGTYHVSGYALCNALTYEVEYYEELPDFAK